MTAVTAMPWVATVVRLVLAGVLGLAGALKLPDPDAMVRAVRAYRLLPEGLVQVVGFGLPVLEVAVAVLLLLGLATRLAAVVTAVLMGVFAIGVASAWARGLTIDCGCFGSGGEVAAGQTSYPQVVTRDAALVLAAGLLAWRPASRLSLDSLLSSSRSTEKPVPEGVSS